MQTECKTLPLTNQLEFPGIERRAVVAEFNGGEITSDGGALLLRQLEERSGVVAGFARCFEDYRDERLVEHTVEELIKQRVYGLALGYEDLNDHDDLRRDSLLATVVGKKDPTGQDRLREQDQGKALAGKSTLNRLELAGKGRNVARYKKIEARGEEIEAYLVEVFLNQQRGVPERLILDVDATDDVLHGKQEGRFFHGYYSHYCYLPLYIFCEGFVLCAKLRRSNMDASEGVVTELERIVRQIRERWPQVEIWIRGDSGFARNELMTWCEGNNVEYVLGMAKNSRLLENIDTELANARRAYEETEESARVFADFSYQTLDSWSCKRRVIAKAEHLAKGPNPRFVVTSLSQEYGAQEIYEKLYCVRGETAENRIKEQQLELFADRTSSSHMAANQLRLWLSTVAYTMLHLLRIQGLKGTDLARAQCGTIRLKLLKIGAQIRISVRRVVVSLASGYPYQQLFAQVFRNLTPKTV